MSTRIDLDLYKDDILLLFRSNSTSDQIARILHQRHGISVVGRTIQRRLHDWQETKRQRTIDSAALRGEIAALYFGAGFNDQEMLRALQEAGHQLGLTGLVRIRKDMNIYQSISADRFEEVENSLRSIISAEFEKGEIEGFGRGLLHTHFRNLGLAIARDRLFKLVKEIDPVGVARRTADMQRHRGEYIVPGPNFLWSIDGHCKLSLYGIDIYAAIDAYSRFVVWSYVGISARTEVSVLRQYLDTITTRNCQPKIIRADRGSETPLCAEAHFLLRQKQDPGLQFQQCFFYGTSTLNQRIEAWWAQLTKSQLFRWTDFFAELRAENLWSKDQLQDRISLLAIYMPIIRKEVAHFVQIWNNHIIRKQNNRPRSVSGRPFKLYNYPSPPVRNHGNAPDPETLRVLAADVDQWDKEEYLPVFTRLWCETKLKSQNVDVHRLSAATVTANGTRQHKLIYLSLRDAVKLHIDSNQLPKLEESMRPTGGVQWRPRNLADSVESLDLEQDS